MADIDLWVFEDLHHILVALVTSNDERSGSLVIRLVDIDHWMLEQELHHSFGRPLRGKLEIGKAGDEARTAANWWRCWKYSRPTQHRHVIKFV